MDLKTAQSEIDGQKVAKMILEFYEAFGGVYNPSVLVSDLCAVGPLQAMIGLAIKNGHLRLPPPPKRELTEYERKALRGFERGWM